MVVRDRRAKMRWPDGQMKRGGHCFARTTTPGLSLQSSMALRGPSDPDIPLEAIPPFPGSNPGAPASKCGLGDGTSRYGRTRDISAIRRPEFAADWDATVERVMKGLREALGLVVDAADGEADGVAAVTRLLALPTLTGFRTYPHGARWPHDHCPTRS